MNQWVEVKRDRSLTFMRNDHIIQNVFTQIKLHLAVFTTTIMSSCVIQWESIIPTYILVLGSWEHIGPNHMANALTRWGLSNCDVKYKLLKLRPCGRPHYITAHIATERLIALEGFWGYNLTISSGLVSNQLMKESYQHVLRDKPKARPLHSIVGETVHLARSVLRITVHHIIWFRRD